MDELISRAALLNDLSYCAPELWQDEEYIKSKIMKQPAVDAVPVVRCSECRWNDRGHNEVDSWDDCRLHRITVYPTFYCANGERRDEHAAD